MLRCLSTDHEELNDFMDELMNKNTIENLRFLGLEENTLEKTLKKNPDGTSALRNGYGSMDHFMPTQNLHGQTYHDL